jgi:methylenetetrahydrofolate reductase (NADPH)
LVKNKYLAKIKQNKMKNIPVSFEFFPPKTADGIANLRETRAQLASFNPEFFSVTFGAGGSTRDRTMETVFEIQAEGHEAAPHISCISSSKEEIRDLLIAYKNKGIKRLVTLRGDVPSGEVSAGDFKYAAELVAYIRKETGDWFHLDVAAYPEFHPEATSAAKDIANFKHKVEAGANSAITQYFYNADAYFRFLDSTSKEGIKIPIVPGVMPIYNYTQLARFSAICGAEIPRWLRLRLEAYEDDLPSLRAFGVDVVSDLCETLLASGAPSLHFYTLNQAGIISTIIKNTCPK